VHSYMRRKVLSRSQYFDFDVKFVEMKLFLESSQVLKDYSFWAKLLRPETENDLTERDTSSGKASEMYSEVHQSGRDLSFHIFCNLSLAVVLPWMKGRTKNK
jgi:hypothetical protein